MGYSGPEYDLWQILLAAKSQYKSYLALAVISFFWGTTWFVSKLIVRDIPPLQMTGIRQVVAGLILIGYFFLKGIRFPTKREFLYHLLCGFLLITCSNGLTTWAIKYIPSFLGALISCLMPFVMILSNSFFFNERVKPVVYLALLVGFAGVSMLLLSFRQEMHGAHFTMGIVLSLISVATWTGGTLLSTRNRMNINPFEGIGWQMFLGGCMLLLSSLLTGQYTSISGIPAMAWIEVAYLILVGSLLCFMCYLYALKTLPVSLVSIYVYINPMVAMLLGVIFLNEKITLQIVAGIIVTLAGIYLVKRFSGN